MKFKIKDTTNRNNTNLLNHQNNIKTAVQSVFPNCRVDIFSDYFEISNVSSWSNKDLRSIGKQIVNNDLILKGLCKNYTYTRSNGNKGTSKQLFVRF